MHFGGHKVSFRRLEMCLYHPYPRLTSTTDRRRNIGRRHRCARPKPREQLLEFLGSQLGEFSWGLGHSYTSLANIRAATGEPGRKV
jgi:hypothetical protein